MPALHFFHSDSDSGGEADAGADAHPDRYFTITIYSGRDRNGKSWQSGWDGCSRRLPHPDW